MKSHWSSYILFPSSSPVCGPEDAQRRVFRRRSLPPSLFTRWSGSLGHLVLSAIHSACQTDLDFPSMYRCMPCGEFNFRFVPWQALEHAQDLLQQARCLCVGRAGGSGRGSVLRDEALSVKHLPVRRQEKKKKRGHKKTNAIFFRTYY